MAAVSNLGDDPNWTGHEFSAAITYSYGRLAWDPTLSTEQVTAEWVTATYSKPCPHMITSLPFFKMVPKNLDLRCVFHVSPSSIKRF